MSVTFWCPDAPTYKSQPFAQDDPDFVMDVSTLPEIQVSTDNAKALVEILGMGPMAPGDTCGSLVASRLPCLLSRIEQVAASPLERAAFLEPAVASPEFQQVDVELEAAVTADAHPSRLGELLARKLNLVAPALDGAQVGTEQCQTRYYYPGRSDEYLLRQVLRMKDLAEQAMSGGYAISWG